MHISIILPFLLKTPKKFAEEVRNNNIRSIFLFKYGESFSDKEMIKKIDIIKSLNPNVEFQISTNGMLLDMWDNMEAALKLDYITFSLDGVDDKTVSGFQQKGSFDRAFKNMCDLVKERNRLNQEKPIIRWKYVLFPHNHYEKYIVNAFKMAAEAGVDLLNFIIGFNTDSKSDVL